MTIDIPSLTHQVYTIYPYPSSTIFALHFDYDYVTVSNFATSNSRSPPLETRESDVYVRTTSSLLSLSLGLRVLVNLWDQQGLSLRDCIPQTIKTEARLRLLDTHFSYSTS